MRRRRATFIAATAATALLATLGIGAHQVDQREPSPETCKTDLTAVFQWCGIDRNSGCTYVDEAEVDACEAGCVMVLCPEQITCTALDPMWCGKSCADPQGARYWSNLDGAHRVCDGMFDHLPVDEDGVRHLTEAQWNTKVGCIGTHMRQHCPEVTYGLRQPPPDDPTE